MFLLLLCPALGAAWLGYWILWVKIFQYMNRYEPVPPAVERAADVCLVVCAAAVTALAVAMMTAVSDCAVRRPQLPIRVRTSNSSGKNVRSRARRRKSTPEEPPVPLL